MTEQIPPVTWPYHPYPRGGMVLDAEAPSLNVYLVVDGCGGGGVGYAGIDRDRAHEYARNVGGVVARLPVVGDYREQASDTGTVAS